MTRSVEIAADGLRHLITISRDAELAYKRAARLTRSTQLAALLVEFGLRHQEHTAALRRCVNLSVSALQANAGTPRGSFHRAWMAARARFNVERDRVLLQELLAMETRTIDHYERVLGDARLPEHIAKSLHRQLEEARRDASWLRKAERAPARAAELTKRQAEVRARHAAG